MKIQYLNGISVLFNVNCSNYFLLIIGLIYDIIIVQGVINMTLARKIEEILKGELNPDSIKTVIDIAEFLKFKENKIIWDKIKEKEHEYISEEEHQKLEEIKMNGEFIDQEDLFQELGISKDDI